MFVSDKTYKQFSDSICKLLEEARRHTVRSVNAILAATYWEIGRRVVEFEQEGKERAEYGSALLQRLSKDLTKRFGRGFGVDNLQRMRAFYLEYKPETIYATLSRKSNEENVSSEKYATLSHISVEQVHQIKSKTASRIFTLKELASVFPLPWSAYVRLLSVKNDHARTFYETEALRGGWSVRQLNRQISSQFYERTLLSRNKAAMLEKGSTPENNDITSPEEEIKDPFVLEFLGLKDEYSENDLEEALIHHLETFLLELGSGFAFIARQKRLRVGNKWYRVDLVFYHRRLRCLVLIDLKVGEFSHADAGQMHLYCNYASEHWTNEAENPPVGLILCAEKDNAVAKYALDRLPNKILTSEYKLVLPNEEELVEELIKTRKMLESRKK
ncbi:MAG: PDDEXK nuclease domain-containing protein [Thermodesulfobacteriota bacterium]|nr:PDDEXK nuclease domain-containing protein [Thermodesulfobacteriota bacterium]